MGVHKLFKYLPSIFENTQRLAYKIVSMSENTYPSDQVITLMNEINVL